jgi:hypothetical protein
MWPLLRLIVTNNFVRGGISGLGLVNVVAGFVDLARAFAAREQSGVSVGDGNRSRLR